MEMLTTWIIRIGELSGNSRILGALVILAVSLITAKLANLFMHHILSRVAGQLGFRWEDFMLEALRRPLYLSIVILGGLGGLTWLERNGKATYVLSGLMQTALLIVWLFAVSGMLKAGCEAWCSRAKGHGVEIIHFVENFSRILLFVGGGFLGLSIWDVSLTPLLASAGLAGVAVALGAKETLSNFLGGVNVLFDKSYRTGDYIVLGSGERGEVVHIGVRSTKIVTRDDVQISIPNSIMANTKIVNESAPRPSFRIRVKIGVAYGSDIDVVESLLLSVAGANDLVLRNPEPRVRFRGFGDSSLETELLCWVHAAASKGLVVHELVRAIYTTFHREGINIPFPQHDIHVRSFPEGEKARTRGPAAAEVLLPPPAGITKQDG